jgi:GTP cyclohydrolase III
MDKIEFKKRIEIAYEKDTVLGFQYETYPELFEEVQEAKGNLSQERFDFLADRFGYEEVACIEKKISGCWHIHVNIVDTINNEPLEASVYWQGENTTDRGSIQGRIYYTIEKGFYDENGKGLYI